MNVYALDTSSNVTKISPINSKNTYILNNNIYNFIYIPHKSFEDLLFIQNKYIGYVLIKSENNNTFFVNYFTEKNKTITSNNQYHLKSEYKTEIIDAFRRLDKPVIIKQIKITIGKGGSGAKYKKEEGINVCPENGGDTIIEFPICDRNFNWLNYKHIEKGGKTTNQDNNYMNQNQYKYNLKNYTNNKGSIHPFFNYNNSCSGGAGGSINQEEKPNQLIYDNTIAAKGNKFYTDLENGLFQIDNTKFYLYKSYSTNQYIITSDKNKIELTPEGGNGGKLNDTDLDGKSTNSYGCGGGSGSKKIDIDKNIKNFGNGGNGAKGCVIILDNKGNTIFNSTSTNFKNKNSFLLNIESSQNTNTACSTLSIDIPTGYFYIISVGGGGGGEISGYGGNGADMSIMKLYNYNYDDNIDFIPNDFKNDFTLFKTNNSQYNQLQRETKIYNSINNIYTI